MLPKQTEENNNKFILENGKHEEFVTFIGILIVIKICVKKTFLICISLLFYILYVHRTKKRRKHSFHVTDCSVHSAEKNELLKRKII